MRGRRYGKSSGFSHEMHLFFGIGDSVMERQKRKYVPEGLAPTESLEQRICMTSSQIAGGMPGVGQNQTVNAAAAVPGYGSTTSAWAQSRQTRIDRVPGSFAEIDPTQKIPRAITASIQANLQQLLGTITGKALPNQRTAMNELLKAMVPKNAVSQQSATAMNKVFGEMLVSAGANPTIAMNLQNDMLQLTQAAIATSSQPSFAVSNNYIFMYYVATTVGWNIPTPGAPQLLPKLNTNPNGQPITSSRRPQFTGTYTPNMTIEILDVSNGNILAKGVSQANGRFTTNSTTSWVPGVYVLTARGRTSAGEYSQFSPHSILTITAGPTSTRAPRTR